MQPKIIAMDALYIAGLTGDGANTGEVWNELDRQYSVNPFPKADESAYEIRFYDAEEAVVTGKDIHVGFSVEGSNEINGFATVALPASQYAVFDVHVAKGYNSGDASMNKWLAENKTRYRQRQLGGHNFVVECYNENFKNGNHPDSIVEIWIPVVWFCQTCDMPVTKAEDSGAENLCLHCRENGAPGVVTIDTLVADVQKLLDIETAHPNLISTPLLDYIKKWRALENSEKIKTIPSLHKELVDGQDCDWRGTQWEEGWLADGGICHCPACDTTRRCISDIGLMEAKGTARRIL